MKFTIKDKVVTAESETPKDAYLLVGLMFEKQEEVRGDEITGKRGRPKTTPQNQEKRWVAPHKSKSKFGKVYTITGFWVKAHRKSRKSDTSYPQLTKGPQGEYKNRRFVDEKGREWPSRQSWVLSQKSWKVRKAKYGHTGNKEGVAGAALAEKRKQERSTPVERDLSTQLMEQHITAEGPVPTRPGGLLDD